MAKYVLEHVFDFDFSLLAVTSSEPDYKLCIHFNRVLGIDLVRDAPIDLSAKNMQTPLTFACFTYEEPEDFHQYLLISNRSINSLVTADKVKAAPTLFDGDSPADIKGFLVPELAQYDYLFMLKGEDHETLAQRIQPKLKSITFVQAVQSIQPETLNSKKNLLI